MAFVALPTVAEPVEELLERRRSERDERRRERLHALWLIASGQVGSRMELARQLGRNRETVSRWLEDYVSLIPRSQVALGNALVREVENSPTAVFRMIEPPFSGGGW